MIYHNKELIKELATQLPYIGFSGSSASISEDVLFNHLNYIY